jgi:aminoglycoside phosphotransferase
MNKSPNTLMDEALVWCETVLGPVAVVSDHSKEHGGHESATCRLWTKTGTCYLKVHHTARHWHNEVHAYERWAPAFGGSAPKLLAVHPVEPLALVVGELPGRVVEGAGLAASQERSIWRDAGGALAVLHEWETGECFGPCYRDGTCVEQNPQDARAYVSHKFRKAIEQAVNAGLVGDGELTILEAAYDLVPAFEGEGPVPCHRDYCAPNWLVGEDGRWSGVIDFEFAYWDVRVADFSRDPNWSWIHRPDLVAAFFEGYGRALTSNEEQQLLVAHAEYALGAILWGHEHAFYGFEREGRESLAHLSRILA